MEVVQSMDTESSINALRRSISRRGRPGDIRSDKGGNFVKGKKELREAFATMEPGLNSRVFAAT